MPTLVGADLVQLGFELVRALLGPVSEDDEDQVTQDHVEISSWRRLVVERAAGNGRLQATRSD